MNSSSQHPPVASPPPFAQQGFDPSSVGTQPMPPSQPYPMQAYPQHPQMGYAPHPMHAHYGAPPPAAAPINIVVQNAVHNNAGQAGGLVRASNKSKGTAAFLALFFGGFGVHKFYLGQPVQGVFFFLFCWTLIPAFSALREGLGIAFMTQSTFDIKYNSRLT